MERQRIIIDKNGNKSVRLWCFKQTSKYGVESYELCADRQILEKLREKNEHEGFRVSPIALSWMYGEPDNKEPFTIV